MSDQETAPRQPWQKPTLTPHRVGGLNKFGKFGAGHFHQHLDRVDGVEIRQIMKDHGSPVFIYSERRLRENIRRLRRAFVSRYPAVQLGWSYKTNYLGAVCAIMHQEGSFAEVVSEFEYQKARAAGVPGHAILFNGPWKPRRILEVALPEGARIHIDNLDELYLVESVARDLGITAEVAIRLNFDTGYTETWSRFGFNIENGQAMEAARRIGTSPHLRLKGLHSHIGTFITDVRAYAAEARIMAEFMEAAEYQTGCVIESLDLGGGFASRNNLQGSYLPPDQVVPSFEQYAEAITTALLEATRGREAAGKPRPVLILETGRALVDDAGYLASSVVANKRLANGRRGVVLDAGVNLLFTAFWYHHEVRPVRQLDGFPEDTTLFGPLCMNIDVVRHSIMLPPLDVGEPLVFSPVGAYNNTQWLQFIGYRPAIVMVGEDGQVDRLREPEDLESVRGQERLPERFTRPFAANLSR
ncbi:MAG: alanine racemase [Geothrix sp.]|nr:alanine racemase [Geothrix sp.]